MTLLTRTAPATLLACALLALTRPEGVLVFAVALASLAVAGGLPAAGLLLYSYPLHAPGKPQAPRAAHFPQVRVPSLFLQGTEDPFGGPDELAPHVKKLGAPGTVERVTGGDHGLNVAAKLAAGGKRRPEAEVLAGLAPVVARFLEGL